MSDPNVNSVYLPINPVKDPNGWQNVGTIGVVTSIAPKHKLYRDQTLSYEVTFNNGGGTFDFGYSNAGFGCPYAATCQVDGVSISPAPSSPLHDLAVPISLWEDIYPPDATFISYYCPVGSYIFPYTIPPIAYGRSMTVTVTFGILNFTEVWSPVTTPTPTGPINNGLAALVLDKYMQGSNRTVVAASYPFNLVNGLQPDQSNRDQLDCSPCPNCKR